MLTIPQTIQDLFKADGVRKNFRVHFPNGEMSDINNSNVVQESVKFTESLCSQSTFKFGLAEASVLEFETVGVGNMYGMTIEAGIEIDTSSLSAAQIAAINSNQGDGTLVLVGASDIGYGYYHIPLGTFKVNSCPRNHGAMAHRQVTAYTDTVMTRKLVFPQRMLWDHVDARVSTIKAAASGSGLVTDSTVAMTQTSLNDIPRITLYDSSRNAYEFMLEDHDNSDARMLYGAYVDATSQTDNTSFIKTLMSDYNPTAYEQMGIDVAKAITDAGYSLIYDVNGAQRFDSNEEALRYCVPWLFYPCVCYDFSQLKGGPNLTICVEQIRNNTLAPIVYSNDEIITYNKNVGFFTADNDYRIRPRLVQALVKTSAGNNVRIGFSGVYGFDIDIQTEGYLQAAPTVTRYTLNSYDNTISIQSTSEDNYFYDAAGTLAASYVIKKKGYGFDISDADLLNLYSGALELSAEFSKTNRTGSFEMVKLNNSSPISVAPDSYSEMWWDEFDVDPIGSVVVTYQDKDENGNDRENTTTITIGTGESVYDMSSNEILKNLESGSLSSVTSLVNNNFKPYVGAVAFTPTELTMQGWPWLEAGDALEVTAEDGTVVDTYALRVEMSGIQHLTMSIVSEGGEIIEEVE